MTRVLNNVTILPGGTFYGVVPGYRSGALAPITAAMIVSTANSSILTTGLGLPGTLFKYTICVLTVDSLVDITSQIGSDGTITVSFLANKNALRHIIYAACYTVSGAQVCAAGPNPQNFVHKGSFAVDPGRGDQAVVTRLYFIRVSIYRATLPSSNCVGKWVFRLHQLCRENSVDSVGGNLIQTGYDYEYLLLANFDLLQAMVGSNMLSPYDPSYIALILRETDMLMTQGVNKLAEFAYQGLSIVIFGNILSKTSEPSALPEAQAIMGKILSLHIVSSNGVWYTYWRTESKQQTDYIFIYDDSNNNEGTVDITGPETLFLFDAWTGSQALILNYNRSFSGYTKTPCHLAAEQSVYSCFHVRANL
ncbi:hypothetical protein AOQ84DRAFT_382034 [Glonium stellatum]|uniref:Uncharacterized protein n=1 Tax=Glonium stellatum TaxID=574774 RepID=A0A8E2EQK9_9PEZI|nr:hypothetical protein AOQ84DRAFT_382034 [Glonium stellatum]